MSAPENPEQLPRRHFLRGMSREALGMAATLVGASSAIGSIALRAVALERPATTVPTPAPAPLVDASRAGYRRDQTGALLVADRSTSSADRWLACPDGAALARLLARHHVTSGPVLGPLAAWALAGTVGATQAMDTAARLNVLGATAALLRRARPASAVLASTLDDCAAAWTEDPAAVDLAGRLDAMAAIRASDVRTAIGRIAAETAALIGLLPPGDLVFHGAMSTRAGGEVGTARAVVEALGPDPRRTSLVTTSTPTGEGAATREDLSRSGAPVSGVADASVASVLGAGRVAAVLVAAEWMGTDGSVVAPAGALGLAVLAAYHGVPLLVLDASGVAPRPLPVLPAPRPAALERPTNDAPPLMEVVPGELVTAVVKGEVA